MGLKRWFHRRQLAKAWEQRCLANQQNHDPSVISESECCDQFYKLLDIYSKLYHPGRNVFTLKDLTKIDPSLRDLTYGITLNAVHWDIEHRMANPEISPQAKQRIWDAWKAEGVIRGQWSDSWSVNV